MTLRVLFLCTGNSARSQMAEHLLRTLGKDDFEVFSAGTEPTRVNPLTIEVLAEVKIDASGARSKGLDEFLGQSFDYVITVCDRAKDNCPTFPGDSERIHWRFADPETAAGEPIKAFRRIRTEIANRLHSWIPAVTRAHSSG